VIVADTTGASFPFLRELASPDARVVITATDSAAERYETVFPEFFTRALESAASDLDKDGRTSIWEIFTVASRGVQRYYEDKGQLSTERALLDDLGDGVGKEAEQPGADSHVAEAWFLGPMPAPHTSADPRMAALQQRQAALLADLSDLRGRRATMSPGAFAEAEEKLLTELARVSRDLRGKQ
jgi:hypothetical protein